MSRVVSGYEIAGWAGTRRRVFRSKMVIAGLIILGTFAVLTVIHPVLQATVWSSEPSVYHPQTGHDRTILHPSSPSLDHLLGTDPLDRPFTGERSYLRIGASNKIREHYTISRGTEPESATEIGDDNYIMTCGHIAHNCRIGDDNVIASCALVAGYVSIEDQAFISGGVVIHQFSKIGRLAMIGGNTRVNADVPPYFLYSGFNVAPAGLNLVGLKRAGFRASDIAPLKTAFRLLYKSGLKLEEALRRIEAEVPTEHTLHLIAFIRSSKRGICRG